MKYYVFPIDSMTSIGRLYAAYHENGTLIRTHYCSNDDWAKQDLKMDDMDMIFINIDTQEGRNQVNSVLGIKLFDNV